MSELHHFEQVKISTSSALHNFFAQVTIHVPDAIQKQIDGDDITWYINSFLVVTDYKFDHLKNIESIEMLTDELSELATKSNVEMHFVRFELTPEFEPIWVFECLCSISDDCEVVAHLKFTSQKFIDGHLLDYTDRNRKKLIVDQESGNWGHEAQLILLKMID